MIDDFYLLIPVGNTTLVAHVYWLLDCQNKNKKYKKIHKWISCSSFFLTNVPGTTALCYCKSLKKV